MSRRGSWALSAWLFIETAARAASLSPQRASRRQRRVNLRYRLSTVPSGNIYPTNDSRLRTSSALPGTKATSQSDFTRTGRPGEVFLRMSKEGSVISGLMDTIATMTSVALQYGMPLESLVEKFSHKRFEPSGYTNNKDIPIAKSIVDYVFRWLGLKFLATKPTCGRWR